MNTTGLKFSKEHEWVRVENKRAYIGISDFAQSSLGDIVFVDLPNAGASVTCGEVLASVESVKAVSDIFAPISGTVAEVNEALNDDPQLLSTSPYEHWLVIMEIDSQDELDSLMDSAEYEKFCEENC